MADGRSRDAARRLDPRLHRGEPVPEARGARYTHLLVRRDATDGPPFADHPLPKDFGVAARFDDGQVFEVTAPLPADLYGNDDGVLSARARCGLVVAVDGSGRGLDRRERQRSAGRRQPSASRCRRSTGRAAWSCDSTGAPCRRWSSSHRVASTGLVPSPSFPATTSSCSIPLKPRPWPAT